MVGEGRLQVEQQSFSSSSREASFGSSQLLRMLQGQRVKLMDLGVVAVIELSNEDLLLLPVYVTQLQHLHVLGCKQVTGELQEMMEQVPLDRRLGWHGNLDDPITIRCQ
jgi:hypothetical protein